jgi:predicted nucleic acid-binding protein
VVDTSIALAWGFPDERSATADRFWSEVQSGARLHVPPLWWYECANALVVARRRDRITEGQAATLGDLLASLPLTTSERPLGDDMARLRLQAEACGLSAYDAAYIDLARRLRAGLATLDERLADAARREGLEVFPG